MKNSFFVRACPRLPASPNIRLVALVFLLFAGYARISAFEWTIALVNRNGDAVIAADKPVQLRTGDVVNFLLKSGADCFVYVIAQSADNSVFVLHSEPLKKDEELRVGPLELTAPSGTETFFVVASASSQRRLEEAVAAYNRSPNSSRAARSVLNELLALRRDVSALKQNPEQPVNMGGAFRGKDIQGLRFSGAETYVRTFSLNH